jgi:hypothetical protein
MATKKTHAKSQSGRPITHALVVELCEKARAGVDVEAIERRRGGRPTMGSAPASIESVRLDPELRQAPPRRRGPRHQTTSAVMREAPRRYLGVA